MSSILDERPDVVRAPLSQPFFFRGSRKLADSLPFRRCMEIQFAKTMATTRAATLTIPLPLLERGSPALLWAVG